MPRSKRFLAAVLVMVGVIVTTPTPTLRWPDTLPGKLEITIGETVVDVFAPKHVLGQRIRIAYGAPNEHSNVLPGSIAFELDNPDGDYTPDHPMSVYWPDIQLGMTVVWSVYWLGQWWVRFTGQVSEWKPYWPYGDLSNLKGAKGEARVSVVASGLLRQLGQGRSPLRSALYRAMVGFAPAEHWSLEDGPDATQFASSTGGEPGIGEAGGPPSGIDLPEPAGYPGFLGSAPSVLLPEHAIIHLPVRPYTDNSQWVVQGAFVHDASADVVELEAYLDSGRVVTASLAADFNVLEVFVEDDGSVIFSDFDTISGSGSIVDEQLSVMIALDDASGGTIVVRVLDGDGTIRAEVSGAGVGYSTVDRMRIDNASGTVGASHVGLFTSTSFDPDTDTVEIARAMAGYSGEQAHERADRLCLEAGILITIIGDESALMGPQQIDTLYNLLAACAYVDIGILHEDREALALVYRCGSTLYNQDPALTLNAKRNELAPPFRPALDDLGVRNDVTIERINGSEFRSVIESGPRSVQPAPDGVGTFDEKLPLNVLTDEQTRFNAGWRTWRGTWQGMRYARISPAINAVPSVADSWLTTGLGDLMVVTDLPPQHPPYDVEVLLRGYAEEYTGETWEVITNASPAGPYAVGIAGDGDEPSAWPQTGDETAIVTALGKGATTVVAHIDGDLFTTDSAELADSPLSVMVGGEVMPVDSIGSSILDRFARSVGAGSWGTSESGHTYLHTDSAIVSVNGTQGVIALSTINSERHSTASLGVTGFQDVQAWNTLAVTPTGAPINWGILLSYADNGNSYYWADVQVQTSGALTLRLIKRESAISLTQMTTVTAPITHSTSVPRVLRAQYDPGTGVFRSRIWSSDASEPTDTWHLSTVDTSVAPGPRVGVLARLMTGNTNVTPVSFAFDNFELLNPQTFTVQRTLPKTHLPGHPKRSLLSVHRPLIAAH